MTLRDYTANVISASKVVPDGAFQNSAASGVWDINEALDLIKGGNWPTTGNFSPSAFVDGLFQTHLYTGTGSAQTITNNIDLTKGGLVWMKSRTGTDEHTLMDTEIGTGSYLISHSNNQAGSTSNAYITSYNSNGFSIGSGNQINRSGSDFVSWTFRKQPKFFDVLTYTGNGTAGLTVNHNLGSVPGMIIVKATGLTSHWQVLHRNDGTNWKNLQLDQTGASGSEADYWGNGSSFVAPTSTAFTVGTGSNVNANGYTYIAYVFAHNNSDGGFGEPGDQDIIKCGTFASNSSGDASVTNLGFEPQWLIIKRHDGTSNWTLIDNMRGYSDTLWNPLYADANNAESSSASTRGFPTSTGFEFDGQLSASANYIYMAIRRGGMQTPTVASSVFAATDMSSSTLANTGFAVDMSIDSQRTSSSSNFVNDRLRGSGVYMNTDGTTAEQTGGSRHFDSNQGVIYTSAFTGINWSWKRARGYFDMVAYTGTGSGSQNVSHNLGVVPEMMWIKVRNDADNWTVYHSALGNTKRLLLNGNDAVSSANNIFFNNTTPTSSVFTVDAIANGSYNYIAYLFATVAGVSKVGSYTGNGNATGPTVDCGFTNGTKWVLLKRTSGLQNWYVYDTARGLTSGDDKELELNSNSSERTGQVLNSTTSGFQLATSSSFANENGSTFIFYAIANDPS